MSTTVLNLGKGKVSCFGGPDDLGVGPTEGLALALASDIVAGPFVGLFLPEPPKDAEGNDIPGIARRLNPHTYYCALRWDEVLKPFGLDYFTDEKRDLATTAMLRNAVVRITNPRTGACLFARPVDYGPGDGRVVDGQHDPDTERLGDLSPACLQFLGLVTDDIAGFELILPKAEDPEVRQ